jgi:hypothetical protein
LRFNDHVPRCDLRMLQGFGKRIDRAGRNAVPLENVKSMGGRRGNHVGFDFALQFIEMAAPKRIGRNARILGENIEAERLGELAKQCVVADGEIAVSKSAAWMGVSPFVIASSDQGERAHSTH